MKLIKLNLINFSNLKLKSCYLRYLNGGFAKTSRNLGLPSDGPDMVDNCDKTTFADGSTSSTDVIKQ